MGTHIKKDHAWFEHALEQPTQTGLEFPTFGERDEHVVIAARTIKIADQGSDQYGVIVDWKQNPASSVSNDIGLFVECDSQLLEPAQCLFKSQQPCLCRRDFRAGRQVFNYPHDAINLSCLFSKARQIGLEGIELSGLFDKSFAVEARQIGLEGIELSGFVSEPLVDGARQAGQVACGCMNSISLRAYLLVEMRKPLDERTKEELALSKHDTARTINQRAERPPGGAAEVGEASDKFHPMELDSKPTFIRSESDGCERVCLIDFD